jgi:penicillin-binding protein 1A
MASGARTPPYVIRQIVNRSGQVLSGGRRAPVPVVNSRALGLIQEGLRGVVRLPTGTAHALDSRGFPIAVMGKTGTTNEFNDAVFVGSTYGAGGITVAVRIGFDDNRSLGPRETGGRVALPVFREVMLKVYGEGIVGAAPAFPNQMELRITRSLQADDPALVTSGPTAPPSPTPLGSIDEP